MARLTYSTIVSLDGYISDATGRFDWAAPDDEVHAFVNDLERPIGTYLYGRGMYETMVAWETMDPVAYPKTVMRDYTAIWRAAEKVVYSTTLESPSSERTRIERQFEPEAIRRLKAGSAKELSIGGAGLAAQAFGAGLIDVCQLFVVPIIVGGGTRALPDAVRLPLGLVDERRFANGTVYLHYRARR